MTTTMAHCSANGTSHRTVVASWDFHGPHRKATRKPACPQEILASDLHHSQKTYFPGQCAGEHIGAGAPPSAKDTVDTAPNTSRVARIKRTTFFMKTSLVGIVCGRFPLETHPSFFKARGWKCSKNARSLGSAASVCRQKKRRSGVQAGAIPNDSAPLPN